MGSSGAVWAGLSNNNYINQIKNKIPLKTLNLQKLIIFKVLINVIIITKIRARPKIHHKTPLYTTICITYFYNYTKIIYPYSKPTGVFWRTLLLNKTSFKPRYNY